MINNDYTGKDLLSTDYRASPEQGASILISLSPHNNLLGQVYYYPCLIQGRHGVPENLNNLPKIK